MIKKSYAKPTMKVVELDMADIVCESLDVDSNAGLSKRGSGTTDTYNRNRANGRTIWDEE